MAENQLGAAGETVRIEIMFKEYGSFIKVYISNITNGGLFIRTDTPLPIDAPVRLHMRLPEETKDIEIDGRVVWSFARSNKKAILPKGMGIQFVNMLPENAEKIKKITDRFRSEIERFSIF